MKEWKRWWLILAMLLAQLLHPSAAMAHRFLEPITPPYPPRPQNRGLGSPLSRVNEYLLLIAVA